MKFLHFKETKKISKVIDTKKQESDNVITETNKQDNKVTKIATVKNGDVTNTVYLNKEGDYLIVSADSEGIADDTLVCFSLEEAMLQAEQITFIARG